MYGEGDVDRHPAMTQAASAHANRNANLEAQFDRSHMGQLAVCRKTLPVRAPGLQDNLVALH